MNNLVLGFGRYKGRLYEDAAREIIENDKKYLHTMGKMKNRGVENFLSYFYNIFEPSYGKSEIPSEIVVPVKIDFYELETDKREITNIFHISDIHIRLYSRTDEYQNVFIKLYQFIRDQLFINSSQIIVITGDLLHSKNTLSPECVLTTQNFLINLSRLTTTLLIAGNHDALLTNTQREDSITAIVENVSIPNFYYLKNSGVYFLSNLAIAVNSLLDNKWITANFQTKENTTHKICLYHGSVGLCETGVGYRMRGEKLVEDFDGFDYILLGDIHKFQFLDEKRMAYASSLIAQNFNEWNSPHGVLHWDLFNKNHRYYSIENKCGFFVFNLINNQIFVDNTPIEVDDIFKYLKDLSTSINIKLNIQNSTHDFISKINFIVKSCSNNVKITHNFITCKKEGIRGSIENMEQFDMESIQNLLVDFIKKTDPKLGEEDIRYILEKYKELQVDLQFFSEKNDSRWELIDLDFSNLFGYGSNNYIDFSRFTTEGPIGIIAPNSHGKSSLIDIILFTLFSKFSRNRGTGVSKDIINIHCTNFYSKLRFKIGSTIYIVIKEGKREHTDKVKIIKNEFYKYDDEKMVLLTDEDRRKTDKVIVDLIGSYEDFIFTNVQLQSRMNSFKEMTDRERKEYLYKVLKLNIWNEMLKRIIELIKPIKSSVIYLEKLLEKVNKDELNEKIQEIIVKISICQDEIEQQLYEKYINKEIIDDLRLELYPGVERFNNISDVELGDIDNNIEKCEKELLEIDFCEFTLNEEGIENEYFENKIKFDKKIRDLQNKLNGETLISLIPVDKFISRLNYRELSLEEINKKMGELEIDETQEEKYKNMQNELLILQNKIEIIDLKVDINDIRKQYKLRIKERDLINSKIENYKEEISGLNQIKIKKWVDETPLRNKLNEFYKERDLIKNFIKELKNHKYDPKCKFCIQHPTVKTIKEKEKELDDINIKIEEIIVEVKDNMEEDKNKLDFLNSKIEEKNNKILILDNTIIKLEYELERIKVVEEKIEKNNLLQKQINELNLKLEEIEKIVNKIKLEKKEFNILKKDQEILEEIQEIQKQNDEIKIKNSKIYNLRNDIIVCSEIFNELEISKKFKLLQEQKETKILMKSKKNLIEKKIEELKSYKKNIKNYIRNNKIKNILNNIQLKIENNDSEINKLNEKFGILNQQHDTLKKEIKLYQEQYNELEIKKREYKLIQILEDSLGKDGLPLQILKNYLMPITDSINNIIAPFISRKISLRIENEDLILDSYPSIDNPRSVYMHGGMESFILDIAFKITLSNFAKLPKCNILFLDEGISAFDTERLNNIDILFDFIRRYFAKTIVITHIDSVKENIEEKITIIKDNQFSKIICEYSRDIS